MGGSSFWRVCLRVFLKFLRKIEIWVCVRHAGVCLFACLVDVWGGSFVCGVRVWRDVVLEGGEMLGLAFWLGVRVLLVLFDAYGLV